MDIAEIISNFAQAVASFKVMLEQQSTAKKLANATRTYGQQLGTDTLKIKGVEVNAADLTEVFKYFESLISGEDATRIDLTKKANYLETALEFETVPKANVKAAQEALQAWSEVSTSPKGKK